MIPAPQDIKVKRGDHFSLFLRIKKKSDSTYVDLTGWTGVAKIKDTYEGTVLATFTILFSDQVAYKGGVLLYMTKTVTSALTFTGTEQFKDIGFWDVELTNTNGEPNTYLGGKVTLYKDIS
jgi:hypothetical protein